MSKASADNIRLITAYGQHWTTNTNIIAALVNRLGGRVVLTKDELDVEQSHVSSIYIGNPAYLNAGEFLVSTNVPTGQRVRTVAETHFSFTEVSD